LAFDSDDAHKILQGFMENSPLTILESLPATD
jgi:hypothetical protein